MGVKKESIPSDMTGRSGLITAKGLECIKADVIIYDV